MAGGTTSETAVGGMVSKISAARLATKSGCGVFIASGAEPDIIQRLLAGTGPGHVLRPERAPPRVEEELARLFPEALRHDPGQRLRRPRPQGPGPEPARGRGHRIEGRFRRRRGRRHRRARRRRRSPAAALVLRLRGDRRDRGQEGRPGPGAPPLQAPDGGRSSKRPGAPLNPLSHFREMSGSQWRAFMAAYLGWMLDAFDFFILVMVVRHVAADFHTDIRAVSYAIFLTLAMRPVGALALRPHGRPLRKAARAHAEHPSLRDDRTALGIRAVAGVLSGAPRPLRDRNGRGMGGRRLARDGVRSGPQPRGPFGGPPAGLSGGLPARGARLRARFPPLRLAGHVHRRRDPRLSGPDRQLRGGRVARMGGPPGPCEIGRAPGGRRRRGHAAQGAGRSSFTWSRS